jgi:hypothetical protein
MPISYDKEEKLKVATIKYLSRLTLIHVWHQPNLSTNIDYHQHCPNRKFTSKDNDGPNELFVPIKALEAYLFSIEEEKLADGLVNFKTVSKCIDKALEPYTVIPLASDECETVARQIVDWFNRYYDYRTTSYVPLSNIVISSEVEPLQLANAILYRGFSDSELSKHISNLPKGIVFDVPEQTCFLKFDTTGDDESIERQILEKTQQSLRVLRFCSWTNSSIKGTRRNIYNQAQDVSYFPYHALAGYYLYTNNNNHPFNRYLVNKTSSTSLKIDIEQVETFNLMGRELLNIHFANTGNPISEHILLALEWYDSGLHANTNRDSVYRFMVCLNAIVGWDYNDKNLKSDKMAVRIQKLFKLSATHKNGSISFDIYGQLDGLRDVKGKDAEEVIKKITETCSNLFKTLYQEQRNSILHGKPHGLKKPVTFQHVKNSQLLAQNGLRLIMNLIADNLHWTTLEDVEEWFKSK